MIWITWQNHRRTESLCQELKIKPHVLHTPNSGLKRYLSLIIDTFKLLKQQKPKVLFVQNPSIVLSFLAVLLKPVFGYKLFIDAHNEGVVPFVNDNALFRFITRLLHKFSNYTIVTNDGVAEVVRNNGGEPIVLPDALPLPMTSAKTDRPENKYRVVLISTYAKDEPIEEVLLASQQLENVELSVTGNFKKAQFDISNYPDCHFTGFLSEQEYWQQLTNAELIIDLTTMENCLVCGSYEAIALEKPLLLSEDQSARSLFPTGVRFTRNSSEDIAGAIREIINEYPKINSEMAQLREDYTTYWHTLFSELKAKVRNA